MNHTCLSFPAEAATDLLTPGGWKAELALGGWLVTYRNKRPAPGTEPGLISAPGKFLLISSHRHRHPQISWRPSQC